MAPNNVTNEDDNQIWTRLYGDKDTYLKRLSNVEDGAKVRISRVKRCVRQGIHPQLVPQAIHRVIDGSASRQKRP